MYIIAKILSLSTVITIISRINQHSGRCRYSRSFHRSVINLNSEQLINKIIMKKAILFILISFVYMLICLVFSACEKTVNIDVPEKEPRLAVQAIFEEGEPFYATVSKSRHILVPVNTGTGGGSMWRDYLVTNAVPVIYENGTPVETLVYDASSETYISPANKKARPGFTYSIRVTAPGFKEVEGQAGFPSASEILEVK